MMEATFRSLTLLIVACLANTAVAQIERAKDAPQPLTPAESRQRFRLPGDLSIKLVASEPLIADPSCITFDERGRMFVCELHGYNLDGHEEIVLLNKTGKLDRKIRRIRTVSAKAKKAAEKGTYGTVKLLQDTNGDGRMDKAAIWADRLPPCYGVIAARGGLIVICAPHILYLADRDGDGKAEVKQTLFTGFKVRVLERAINNPRWGPDNWIYVAAGGGGGLIRGPRLKQPVQIGHTDFRIKPDGTAIEPVTGTTSTFGLTQNEFGERFLVAAGPCSYVVPLPHRYLIRNPHVPSPQPIWRAGLYSQVFPASRPHPWRVSRSKNPAWVKFYGQRETTANGYFTSQSGPLLYLANDLPKRLHGNYFVCDPSQNLVHRANLVQAGPGYQLKRFPEESKTEFLTSTDQWFRPMNLINGPDGSIYIVDMYREIIEDFSAIPRFLQQQYGLVMGRNRGRIWKIAAKRAAPAKRRWPADRQPTELVKLLSDPNPWWRYTAQRLLIEQRRVDAVPQLIAVAKRGTPSVSRMHALYTLAGLKKLTPAAIKSGLTDSAHQVRVHALRLCEPHLNRHAEIQNRVVALVADTSHLVRVQLALTLGEWHDARSVAALAKLAQHADETWMSGAILSSAAKTGTLLTSQLLQTQKVPRPVSNLLRLLASSIGSRRDAKEIGHLLTLVADLGKKSKRELKQTHELQSNLLDGLFAGLRRGKTTTTKSPRVERAIDRLLKQSGPIKSRTLQIAGLLRLPAGPLMKKIWHESLASALNPKMTARKRQVAMTTLDTAPWVVRSRLAALLRSNEPLSVQLTAIQTMARGNEPEVSGQLVANFAGLSPQVQSRIVETYFARQDRVVRLLDAMERRKIDFDSIAANRRAQLLESSDKKLAARARKLFAGRINQDRNTVVARFRESLRLKPSAKRGEQLFHKHCAKCHRLKKVGKSVGPDLAGIKSRSNESILIDMFDPSRKIKPGFRVYVVTTTNGRVYTGVLAEESATSVTLKREKGESDTLLRKNIAAMRSSPTSLMPNELEKNVSKQDVADLLGYLRTVLGNR